MKRILKFYLIDLFALYLTSIIASGMIFDNGTKTFLLAGAALMIVSLLAKPVINVLLLPINLVTFGLFRWISTAIVLYIVTLVIPGFSIRLLSFSGYSSPWIDIPSFTLGGAFAYIMFGFCISSIMSFFHWLFD